MNTETHDPVDKGVEERADSQMPRLDAAAHEVEKPGLASRFLPFWKARSLTPILLTIAAASPTEAAVSSVKRATCQATSLARGLRRD